jgi:transcriptional regulator with XRE-family HTH domain
MNLSEVIANRILYLCKERGITLNKLATICGITQSTLNNIICGNSKRPTVSTIKKICDGLNMSLADFFDTLEFHQLEQEVE